jgi:hypothetical protein
MKLCDWSLPAAGKFAHAACMATMRSPAGPAQSASGQTALAAPATIDVPRSATSGIDWNVLSTATRACCCVARPAVIALVPPGQGRAHYTDLLMCMHHFRASRRGLIASNASLLDRNGRLVGIPALPVG